MRTDVEAELKRQLARVVNIVREERSATMILAVRLIEQKILVEAEILEIVDSQTYLPALRT